MTKMELVELLERNGIDVNQFGRGSAKTLQNLLDEVLDGETLLVEADGHLVRRISVLNINVFADVDGKRLRLVEDRQVFSDGRERRRNLPASIGEKLHHTEDLTEALGRAFEEEISVTRFVLLTLTPRKSTVNRVSPSYPGLACEIVVYEFDVLIDPSEFKKEGYSESASHASGFLTSYFVWVQAVTPDS